VVHPAGGQYYRGTGGRAVFAYPVYIGGYYSVPYITQQDPSAYAPVQPNVTVVNQPQAAPPVIINNYYSSAPPSPDATQPMPQSAADSAAPVTEPAHYLIAFQDHTIYAATAYWVDGDTLHYFTSGNVHNQVSLALVDRPLTERLNKEAGVDLKLPAPSKQTAALFPLDSSRGFVRQIVEHSRHTLDFEDLHAHPPQQIVAHNDRLRRHAIH
jgi:hypothetical protein